VSANSVTRHSVKTRARRLASTSCCSTPTMPSAPRPRFPPQTVGGTSSEPVTAALKTPSRASPGSAPSPAHNSNSRRNPASAQPQPSVAPSTSALSRRVSASKPRQSPEAAAQGAAPGRSARIQAAIPPRDNAALNACEK
jgi:hypothetical protein